MCICCQQRTTLINMGSVHRAGRTRTSSMVIQNSHFVNTTMHHSNFFSVFHKKEPHFALFFADDSMRVHNKSLPPFWGEGSACQKSLAEFAANAANRVRIIFGQGVYLTENTSQAASVEFVRCRRTNYARSRL